MLMSCDKGVFKFKWDCCDLEKGTTEFLQQKVENSLQAVSVSFINYIRCLTSAGVDSPGLRVSNKW